MLCTWRSLSQIWDQFLFIYSDLKSCWLMRSCCKWKYLIVGYLLKKLAGEKYFSDDFTYLIVDHEHFLFTKTCQTTLYVVWTLQLHIANTVDYCCTEPLQHIVCLPYSANFVNCTVQNFSDQIFVDGCLGNIWGCKFELKKIAHHASAKF